MSHRMPEKKNHGCEPPSRAVEATPEGLMLAAMERINRGSALRQQHVSLHDVIVLPSDGAAARYYEELPLEHVHGSPLSASDHYYTIALELRDVHDDPFFSQRPPTTDAACESVVLRPVIRRWNGPLLVAEYHLMESLAGEWKDLDHHIAPLRDFFALHLGPRVGVRV